MTLFGETQPPRRVDYERQLIGDHAGRKKAADGQGMALSGLSRALAKCIVSPDAVSSPATLRHLAGHRGHIAARYSPPVRLFAWAHCFYTVGVELASC
jgi:hypothetical protein